MLAEERSLDAKAGHQPLRALYVAYWGVLEPLGQSLVAPSVEGLAARGVAIDLVSFEKPGDLLDADAACRVRKRLSAVGVHWVPLRYHKHPKPLAKVLDVVVGLVVCLWITLRRRVHVVHGRTFIGGFLGCVTARLAGRPWIYHGEGFWPEQQVEAGLWTPGGRAFRITHAIDEWLHRQASGIVLLSRASAGTVKAMPGMASRQTPMVIVPSCVDFERFPAPAARPARPVTLVYAGSLGGRYIYDMFGPVLGAVRQLDPDARLRVYSQSNLSPAADALQSAALPVESWTISHARTDDIPRLLAECTVGLLFQRSGPGSRSGSPTKVGEYWAAGLPVMCTAECGDVDDIIRDRSVGVVLRDLSERSLQGAALAVLALLEDPEITARCRQAAADYYALEPHLDVQLSLYRELSSRAAPATRAADGSGQRL
jgi:glycosyltransferase involved in cell wall biosynthesis